MDHVEILNLINKIGPGLGFSPFILPSPSKCSTQYKVDSTRPDPVSPPFELVG